MRAVVFAASLAAFAAATASMLTARPARACGGCFSPPAPKEVTVVTDHRMAFSVSQQQTVLWDQIEYSGSPQDFAWVLPVMPGAQIQLSHDDFFAALDALTAPTVTGPTPNCAPSGAGCGLGGATSGSANFGAASNGGSGVEVVSQGVIGPYDTVTLHSSDPNALYAWLVANSYDVPDATRPVIDAYVAGGFDFIALRLAPGQGVQAMQPVRVVTQGAGLTLPLRMVAAGVGAQVGITLYVIGEGRYEAQNFPNAMIDDKKLVWLHAESRSNFTDLSKQLMAQDSGRTWLTESAGIFPLYGAPSSGGTYACGATGGGGAPGYYGYGSPTLADLYFSRCGCQGSVPSVDGGVAAPACDGYDDLAVASTGLAQGQTWVTRIRATLPADALSEGDLVLQASASQTARSNQYTAAIYDDPTYSACGSNGGGGGGGRGGGCAIGDEPGAMGRWLVVGSLAMLGGALVRRRRSSTR